MGDEKEQRPLFFSDVHTLLLTWNVIWKYFNYIVIKMCG